MLVHDVNTGKARFYNKYTLIGGKLHTFHNDPNDPPPSPPTPPPSPPSPPPPPDANAKIFSQADLDKKFAEHRKGLQQQNQELVTQLEELKKGKGLSEQEKEALQERIDQINNQFKSKEEQFKTDQDKLQKKYEKETKELSGERDQFKNLWQDTMISNSLISAAVKHKATSDEQIVDLFGRKAKVQQILDDAGKATGRYEVVMPVEVEDPKTKEKSIVELPVEKAIAKIKENPKYFNLFDDTQRSGLGGGNTGGGGSGAMPDFSKMTTEQHIAWRRQQQGKK